MKTSEILSGLTKLRNEIIFKLIANSIISTLIVVALANKFIEHFNGGLVPVVLFFMIVADFVFVIYFIFKSIDKYNVEFEKLIRKLS